VGTWHDPDLGRPIAAPLERCAQLLGVELATVRTLAAQVEPYLRADGTRIWSLMQLERQLRPAAYRRRRGGYLDRRHAPTTDAPVRATVGSIHGQVTASLDLPLGSGIALPTSSEEGGAMAHPNEELVRRGYAAFNTADVETLRQLFADTTVFHEPGRSPISGGTFRATLHDVVANDDHAVGLHSSDAERDGRAVRSPTVLVFHVRDGRITETWSHHHDQHDFDAFWA
jgi:uncharacterized protein